MSKAMLIMDMPSRCGDCPCFDNFNRMCQEEHKFLSMVEINIKNKKPTWCPLREVPQKKEVLNREQYEFGSIGLAFTEGYNACIDEILGGGE